MINLKTHYLLVLCLLHFSIINCNDKYFVLRNPSTGLVLDRSEGWVTLQTFTGFSSQLWKFEPVKEGKSYIVSKHDGKVLDIDSRYKADDSWVVVNKKVNSVPSYRCYNDHEEKFCQLWYVHYGGMIVNACEDGKIALTAGPSVGSYFRTKDMRGDKRKRFIFHYL